MLEMPVQVVRSSRRRRTAQARVEDGRLRVMVPAGLSPAAEKKVVDELVTKVTSRLHSAAVDLGERARDLADRYGLPQPVSIVWSERQARRWGSCTPTEGRVRISSRLASVPPWVLDSVIVHELAHLVESDHGEAFRELVARYPLTERARGYLMAIDERSL
jgi:predicted metal-dependent hydrolase